MSNELTVNSQEVEIMPGFMSLKSFEFTQRAATLLSNSSLVPKEYQNNIPNCVIALNMASRMVADPLMVMQNLYIVYGRPGWSSQFLISTFNTSGRFSALRYEWIGQRGTDKFGCKAWAIEKASGEKLEGSTVTIEIAKKEGWYTKNGSKWQTMSDQMLMYRAASWFIRVYAPEMAMGMHTAEEIIDIGGNDPEFEISQKANKGPVVDIESELRPETVTPQKGESEPSKPEPKVNTTPSGPDF
jgi:hypothetical protein